MSKTLILTIAAILGLSGGLYLALSGRESPAPVSTADYSAIAALREGDLMALNFNANRGSAVPFKGADGSDLTFADFQGKYLLVNFWATWCAPCREEMPHLAELQAEFGGDDFVVLTIASGRNPRPAMEAFFAEIGVENLPLHTDANSALSRDMGVLSLPVTVILDRQGNEIARLTGGADWASDAAKSIISALLAPS